MTSYSMPREVMLSVECPSCNAAVGVECMTPDSYLLDWRDPVNGDRAWVRGVHCKRFSAAVSKTCP